MAIKEFVNSFEVFTTTILQLNTKQAGRDCYARNRALNRLSMLGSRSWSLQQLPRFDRQILPDIETYSLVAVVQAFDPTILLLSLQGNEEQDFQIQNKTQHFPLEHAQAKGP